MKHNCGNIFDLPKEENGIEIFTTLFESASIKIERIFGQHPYTQPGEWYDQEEDEWVVLLEGTAKVEIQNEQIIELKAGDYLFLPAHKIHRVNETSDVKKCIWLAIHGNLK
ncbi:MAG: cupin domain-containing protein [Bacteroidetes bacterium]|nr:cupin domain-containing protein [Bacteroidota bacterium]